MIPCSVLDIQQAFHPACSAPVSVTSAFDLNDPDIVSVCDEIPFWSAPFGLKLLNTVRFRRGISALDIGCGTGFPLLDLAQRLGESCQVTGLDPWEGAHRRIQMKIRTMDIRNVIAVLGNAERMPFAGSSFDLIVSNNGLNNVNDPAAAMMECARVSRPGAQLVLTVNLPDTMKEFYDVYRGVLRGLKMASTLTSLEEHIHGKRKPAEWMVSLVERSGYRIDALEQDTFSLRFADGTALFNHFFIQLAFLEPWRSVIPTGDVERVFRKLEAELNRAAENSRELRLTVPFLCLNAVRE
jgi:arsenite methyltransferase